MHHPGAVVRRALLGKRAQRLVALPPRRRHALGLAGLWNTWIDKAIGEVVESYTMLTMNADGHALMGRMHQPDPKLPPDRQDKRSVVAIALNDTARWLHGSNAEASALMRVPGVEVFAARA